MDAGNLPAEGPEYLAYTLAYGHIGILNGDASGNDKTVCVFASLCKIFILWCRLCPIAYFNNENEQFSSSLAVKYNLVDAPKIKIQYDNGFSVYINFSDNDWKLKLNDRAFTLPRYGMLA